MTKPKLYNYDGKWYTIKQLSALAGITVMAMRTRLAAGWGVKKSVETPILCVRPRYEYKGKLYTMVELAKLNGSLTPSGVKYRLECGQTVEQIVETPPRDRRLNLQRTYVQPIRRSVDLTQCKTCKYRGGGDKETGIFCAYSLIEGHARMFISEPSPHCTVYVKGKSLLRSATMKKMGRGMW